jgi:hypothetical protein
MAFGMFPQDGDQLVLASGETSRLISFTVPPTADSMFLRLIAVGPGCEPFGGAPPIIELRAGTGLIAAVPAAPEEVVIRDELDQDVATARWTREPNDVFKVEITILESADRTWRVRITNDDPQQLGFVWVTSSAEANTRQPRVSLDRRRFVQGVGESQSTFTVEVANIGPGELKFSDTADTDIGGGFTLKRVPPRTAPNRCGTLEFSASRVQSSEDIVISYVIGSNLGDDTEREKGTITLVQVVPGPPEPVSPKEAKDRKDDKDKDDEIEKPGHPPEYTVIDGPLDADFLSGVGEERLTTQLVELQRNISQLAHFIPAALRPDVANRFLEQEAETGTEPEDREPPCG